MGRIEKQKRELIEESNKRILNEQIRRMTVQLQPIEENGFQNIEELNTNGERFNFYDYMVGDYLPIKINGDDCSFKIKKEDGNIYDMVIKDEQSLDNRDVLYKLEIPNELNVDQMSGDTWYGEMIINCKGKQTTMDWEMTD